MYLLATKPIAKYSQGHLASHQEVSGFRTGQKFDFFSAMFVPVPFGEFLRIWSLSLSILLALKYLQPNFEVRSMLRSLSMGLISTVLLQPS